MSAIDQITAAFAGFVANLSSEQLIMMGAIGIAMILLSLVAMIFSGKRKSRPVDHAAVGAKPKPKKAGKNDQFFDRLDRLAGARS